MSDVPKCFPIEWIPIISSADEDGLVDGDAEVVDDLVFHGVVGFYDGYRLTLVGHLLYSFITGKELE